METSAGVGVGVGRVRMSQDRLSDVEIISDDDPCDPSATMHGPVIPQPIAPGTTACLGLKWAVSHTRPSSKDAEMTLRLGYEPSTNSFVHRAAAVHLSAPVVPSALNGCQVAPRFTEVDTTDCPSVGVQLAVQVGMA